MFTPWAQTVRCCHLHSAWIFSPQLNLTGNTLIGTHQDISVILKPIGVTMKLNHCSYIVKTFSSPTTTTITTTPFKWFRYQQCVSHTLSPSHSTNHHIDRYWMKMLGGCVIPVCGTQSKQLLFFGCTQLRAEFNSCEQRLHLVSYIDLGRRCPSNITQKSSYSWLGISAHIPQLVFLNFFSSFTIFLLL